MKVIIAGDFAPRARLAEQIVNRKFSETFTEKIREVIKSADFSFVNFESPIVEDGYKPIPKCGPNLRCTPEAAEAVKYAGFTGVTMANNHILDYGSDGLHKSVECCKSQGLDIVGVGDNLAEAEKVLYLNKDGKRLAVINCCEHEFSIATETEVGANPLNPIRQYYAIKEARSKADFVLVIVHGGHEQFQLPSPRMQETYRFFIDAGADAVVNHHQHCYSGYEIYNGHPIFYGLGNFGFDWENRTSGVWTEGFLVSVDFDEKLGIKFELFPYRQYATLPSICLLDSLEQVIFNESINNLNAVINNITLLNEAVSNYYADCMNYELDRLEPYNKPWQNYLYNKGLLPKVMNKTKCMSLLSHVMCESHLDKLIYALKNKK